MPRSTEMRKKRRNMLSFLLFLLMDLKCMLGASSMYLLKISKGYLSRLEKLWKCEYEERGITSCMLLLISELKNWL
uniref:Uncharacterized protein n=1 Tax=Setaria viridis TaxID=4556 RepID=A0A4U6WDR1_SETVI|nr:hypothetical protein SEVIR_1G209650v2 [Setaria viridis]